MLESFPVLTFIIFMPLLACVLLFLPVFKNDNEHYHIWGMMFALPSLYTPCTRKRT